MVDKRNEHTQATQTIKEEQDPSSTSSKGFLRSLFDDLSAAQVIAGALAAATVFLLSSTIGIAGSLIGTAIGSIVSAVSSQIYKKVLSASADKIRDVTPTTHFEAASIGSAASERTQDNASVNQGTQVIAADQQTRVISEGATELLDAQGVSKQSASQTAEQDSAATRVMNANDVRYTTQGAQDEDPALRRAHARRSRKARIQRNVLIVSVVSSLITIIISAAVITFATAGEGIGEKTTTILPSFTETQDDSDQYAGATHRQSTSTQNQSDSTSSDNQSGNTSTNTDSSQGSDTSSSGSSGNSGSSSSGDTNAGQSDQNSGSNTGNTGTGSGSDGGDSGNTGSNTGNDSSGSGTTNGSGSSSSSSPSGSSN